MTLTLGIIGFPKSGKTTVFNALSRSNAETSAYGTSQTPNIATVKVPDARLDKLTEMFHPKKTTPATVEYTDVAGMMKGAGQSGALPSMNLIQKVDALVHVVRAFDDSNLPHPEGSVNPIRDLETMDLELAFSDLAVIEKRLPRLDDSIKKTRPGPEREAQIFEKEVMEKLNQALGQDTPLRDVELSEEELKAIRGYQFLTLKPLLTILNLGEERVDATAKLLDEAKAAAGGKHRTAIETLRGKIEMEISQLDEDEAAEFMQELGIVESGLTKIIHVSYDLLGLMSFLTAGEDEVRAWTIKRGTPALKAAGEIHSDIERGFIRAETISYDDLLKTGSIPEAKKLGLYRSEGKTYEMRDGDIVNFLFNVSKK
jgi:ribosome-binding ATPase